MRTLGEIAEFIGGEICGDGSVSVVRVVHPAIAQGVSDLAFVLSPKEASVLSSGNVMNAVVPAGNGTGGKVGRKVNMRLAAAKLPAGDFSFSFIAKVWQFCGTDQHDFFRPASYLCTRDQNFWVFEAEWSPYGNSSGLCAGVAIANKIGEDVTLRPCGANDHTLWIANQASGSGGNCRGSADYCPWMNASDSNFRSPNVLTLDSSTKSPADQLRLYQEKLLPAGNQGRARNNQEFAFFLRAGS